MAGPAEKSPKTVENDLDDDISDREMKHAFSLHGSKAAYRRAVTELLFFASVGGEPSQTLLHSFIMCTLPR